MSIATKSARSAKTAKDVQVLARETFGFDSLRPAQQEAIAALKQRHDCLVVMPTGSGKSAIYQIGALLSKGSAVIISPLIALQKDQVDSINATNAPDAVLINSSQRVSEAKKVIEKIEEGSGKYIFLAPEQLHRPETIDLLERANVSLFVVDEAHCISEWGHDFRPDYMQIRATIERLGHPLVLAMTATASQQVRDEIVARLGMRNPKVFVHGFDRPNIYLRVDHFEKDGEKLDALVHRVHWAEKPGIVYVATRNNAETIMHALAEEGVDACFYHAGLKASERQSIQDHFMSGNAEVIVATNAFGMGIDKADVRFVYHYDISESLDSYYQEIGRAGRDGEPAEAVLFFGSKDLGVRKFLAGEGSVDARQYEKVVDVIAYQEGPVEPGKICDEVDMPKRKLASVIQRLEEVGAVEVLPTGEVKAALHVDTAEAARQAAEEQLHRKEEKAERLRQMEEYADTSECRRGQLLRYFGDEFTGACGNCDNCQAQGSNQSNDVHRDPSAGTRREVA